MLASPVNKHLYSVEENNFSSAMPRLRSNTSAQRIHQQAIYNSYSKVPGTAGVTSGRVGSSTANTYEYASNMGGYPVEDPRAKLGGGAQSALGRPIEELTGADDSYNGSIRHQSAMGKSFDKNNFHATAKSS